MSICNPFLSLLPSLQKSGAYVAGIAAAAALLLEVGANPNDDSGGKRPETPLHWAASTDDVDVAVVLIDGSERRVE